MDDSTGQAYIRQRIKVTPQHIAIAKQILLRSKAHSSPTEGLIRSVLEANSVSIPKTITLDEPVGLEASLSSAAVAITWQLAAAEAIWSLIHSGVYVPGHYQLWTPPTGVSVQTRSHGTGWNFDDLSISVPASVTRAPSADQNDRYHLSDPDLYLQSLDAPDLHVEVQAALSEAVRCFRAELYTATVAMLGKASEGSWMLLGAALLRAAGHVYATTFAKQRQTLDDPMAGMRKKIDAVTTIFERADVFKVIQEATGIRPQELRAAVLWSDTVRDSRNTLHFGVTPPIPNTYETVAVQLLAAPRSLGVLYRLKAAADAMP